jgi:Putative transposase
MSFRACRCASKVIFHPASGIDETAVAQVQATLRRRILRAFVGRGLLESFEAKEMLAYRHSGFSVDTSVRIEAHDRAGLERLLRYCARPPFLWSGCAKQVRTWSIAALNSTASPAVIGALTNVVPGLASLPSHHWS